MIRRTFIDGRSLFVETLDRTTHQQGELDSAANALFALFVAREQEFSVNPDVIIEYPDVLADAPGDFLPDAGTYIAGRIAAHEAAGTTVGSVVMLTTYADIVDAPLRHAGFAVMPIDMPAGPDHTAAYRLDRRSESADAKTLYVEAVNEADPKIRPAFALRLLDGDGKLCGGACGSLAVRDGQTYFYLATMTLVDGLPAGTGTQLGAQLVAALRARGVTRIDLGTQTADAFYRKLGFRVVHTVLPRLRHRTGENGAIIHHDLAMLSLDL